VYWKWKEGLLEEAAILILVLTEGHVHSVPIISKSPVPKEYFEKEANISPLEDAGY